MKTELRIRFLNFDESGLYWKQILFDTYILREEGTKALGFKVQINIGEVLMLIEI